VTGTPERGVLPGPTDRADDGAGPLARRVAVAALAAEPADAGALRDSLALALRTERAGGTRTERRRTAGQIALLAGLLSDAAPGLLSDAASGSRADPVGELARHVRFVLAGPVGNPLWADLCRLSALLDDLGSTLRAQRRTARLHPGGVDRVRGTEAVMNRAMASFADTWRRGDAPR
jgi:hypothetical protein